MNQLTLYLLILVSVSACSSNNTLNSGSDTGFTFLENQTLDVEGQSRQYHLFLPENSSTAPIVFLFHGNSGSSDQLLGLDNTVAPYKVWLNIAERENLVLVVPDGNTGSNGRKGWNDCRFDAPTNPDSDDVAFFETLLGEVQSRYNTERSKVYVMGTSNGGHMIQRLADEVPERLNAAAVIVAARPLNSECSESSMPLSILFMNGTADPLVPYEGGQIASNRGSVLSTPDTINYWISRNQAVATPVETSIADSDELDDSTAKRLSYANGTSEHIVELYEVINGGHTEPSVEERYGNLFKLIVGNQNGDLEMAEEVWRFFQRN